MENRTRYAVPGALAEGPCSVHAIKQNLAATVGHFWRESFGQRYPVLRQMAAEGLVVLREEGGPRDRKTYAITDRGQEAPGPGPRNQRS